MPLRSKYAKRKTKSSGFLLHVYQTLRNVCVSFTYYPSPCGLRPQPEEEATSNVDDGTDDVVSWSLEVHDPCHLRLLGRVRSTPGE